MEIDTQTIKMAAMIDMPTMPYDFARWCKAMSEALASLADDFDKQYKQEIERIHRDGILDHDYEVVVDMKTKKTVDIDKLKAEKPKTYMDISKVSNSDAIRLIGHERAYQLARESESFDESMVVVTLGDLKKALGKKSVEYTKTVQVPGSLVFVCKEEQTKAIGENHDVETTR